jgi:hypothetical protein
MFSKKKATTVPWRPVRISLNLKAQIIARALETASAAKIHPPRRAKIHTL